MRSATSASKPTASATTAAATGTATAAAAETGEGRAQLSFGQFAVLVFIQLFKCVRGGLDFLGRNFTVAVGIQCGHDREHAEKTGRATWRASRSPKPSGTTGAARPAGSSAKSAAATKPTGLWSALALGAVAATTLAAFPAAAAFAPWTFAVVVPLGTFATIASSAFAAFTFLREGFTRQQAKPGDGRHEFVCEPIHSCVG